MTPEELYEEIYLELKNYIITNSNYSPNVTKKQPLEMGIKPLVVFSPPEAIFDSETQDKQERKYFITFETNIFTQTQNGIADMTIAQELQKLVIDILDKKLGMKIVTNRPIPNIDLNVYRILIRTTCKFDEDKKIIYR